MPPTRSEKGRSGSPDRRASRAWTSTSRRSSCATSAPAASGGAGSPPTSASPSPAAHGGFVAGVGRSLVRFADLEARAASARRGRAAAPGQSLQRRGRRRARTPVGRHDVDDPRRRAWRRSTACEGDAPPALALPGATISNGLDWNLDATRLYYVDSPTQRIDAIDFDLDRGRLGRRRPFDRHRSGRRASGRPVRRRRRRRLGRAVRRRRDPPLPAGRPARRATCRCR